MMIKTLGKTSSSRTLQILVVEDEGIIALHLKENLESLGYGVVAIAASGEQAISIATELHPDLVLMDIRLKGDMDGIQAAQQIWERLSIPVIYVTGHSDQSTLERAKVTSPFGYILKPVKERELSVAIEIAMQRYEREQLLSTVLREMGDGVIVVDPERRVQFLNKVAESLTGWQLSEAREREYREVFPLVDEQTQQPINDPVTAALQQDISIHLENPILLISQQGKIIPIGYSATPIKDNKGASSGVVLVFQDITSSAQLAKAKVELERALDDLHRTQAQLIQSEKMSSIGRMAAAIVNEINNPISFISCNLPLARSYIKNLLSLVELYQQTYSNSTPEIEHLTEEIDLNFIREDWQKLLHSMEGGAERLLDIILSLQSLRNFSKLDELDLNYVDIHESLDDTLLLLQHRLRAEGKRPEIHVIKEYGQLPLVICYGSQINQVFMHLLHNAIDALQEESGFRHQESGVIPTITIHTEVNTPNNLHNSDSCRLNSPAVVIRIADNGLGMNEEVLSKIFDPYFTTKPVGNSVGLGLSISYQIIVDRHGGNLSCHSTLGQGTEFVIELPIIQGRE